MTEPRILSPADVAELERNGPTYLPCVRDLLASLDAANRHAAEAEKEAERLQRAATAFEAQTGMINQGRAALAEAKAEIGRLRPEVRAFAVAMEERLRANDHKGGWKGECQLWLLERLEDEFAELALAVLDGKPPHEIRDEAADVANFALFVADVAGGLMRGKQGEQHD